MQNGLKIFPVQKGNQHYLQFDFEGDLTKPIAEDGIRQWKTEIEKLGAGQKTHLIFNCLHMNGFETEARKQWQEAMKQFKPQIQDVWVVSENVFIRGAAKTMGLLAGYNIKACKSIAEVG